MSEIPRGELIDISSILKVESTSNRFHNFHVHSPFKINVISTNFPCGNSTSNRWWIDENMSIGQNQCLCWSNRPKGSLKKMLWEILQNSLCQDLFFGIFLWIFQNLVGTPSLQNSTRRLLLIIAVSIVAKGVLPSDTVNYGTKAKAYVLIWARSVSY